MSTSIDLPFTADGVAEYERRRYRGLDQRLVHGREVRILTRLFKKASLAPGVRVLDVPCGYGRFSGMLTRMGGRYVAGDLSPAMVRHTCRRASSRLGAVADAVKGLPFLDGAFGLVFSVRLFHHLRRPEDRRAALAELARVSSDWTLVSYYRDIPVHRWQRTLRRILGRKRRRISMIPASVFEGEAGRAGFQVIRTAALFRGLHAQHFVLLRKKGG